MPESRRARAIAAGLALILVVGLYSLDYTVERGDTLGRIAKEQGVSLTDLVEANDIENPNLIYPGQVLIIPGEEGGPEEVRVAAVVHVVVRGDTLARIASRYGATVSELAEANGISNPNFIRVGQQITVQGSPTESSEPEAVSTESAADGDSATADPSVRTGRFHIVAKGEKLANIASQYSIPADQIAAANGIVNGVIYSGTRLFLDGPAFVAVGTEGEMAYTVVRGDRLGDIAAAHDVSLKTLVELNSISNPNLITPGQRLIIPTGQRWMCPIDDASFFNDWGFPRGGARWHDGNDLFTEHGSPVYAPVPGLVEQKTGSIGGLQVNLHGADGVLYVNSHLSAFGKSGTVRAGDVVGYVGTTGSAQGTRPHVHFEMYLEGGIVVNPYPSLIAHGC